MRFEESLRLDAGMAAQFRLAECHEKVGRIASAWLTFVEVAKAAHAAGLDKRETVARERAAAIEPRLSYLTIAVPVGIAGIPGLEIARDGVIIERAQWDVAVPVDPGAHRVIAKAPGRSPWSSDVQANREGTKTVVNVTMLTGAQAFSPVEKSSSPTPPPGNGPSPVLLGIGYGATAFVAVGGIVFASMSNGQAADADERLSQLRTTQGDPPCQSPGAECSKLLALREDQGLLGNAAVWSFVSAGALGIATTIYALAASSRTTPTGRVYAAPIIVAGGGVFSITSDW